VQACRSSELGRGREILASTTSPNNPAFSAVHWMIGPIFGSIALRGRRSIPSDGPQDSGIARRRSALPYGSMAGVECIAVVR